MNSVLADLSLNMAQGQRRAKIVATLGPASNSEAMFRELVRAGLDVARLNFSHGVNAEKLELIEMIRSVSARRASASASWATFRGPRFVPAASRTRLR